MTAEKGPRASRRGFLKATVLGGAAAAGLPRSGVAEPTAPQDAPPTSEPGQQGTLFDADERRALGRLADLVLPGAGSWGAAAYVEGLLTTFDHEPPRLYPGGVGAGDDWLPLDRVRERGWRLRIHGSEEVAYANAAVLGPVRGLRPVLLEGAREAARRFADGDSAEWVWWRLPGEFREAFIELVVEGALGDPIYGGNRDGAGWRAFHFEGSMLGYGTYHPPAGPHPGEGVGPDPLGPFTRAALWVLGFFSRRLG